MSTNPVPMEVEGGVATLRIDRPEVHNAIDAQTASALEARLDQIEADKEIRVIVLTASGEQTFCAGGDLKYFATLTDEKAVQAMSHRMQRLLDRFYRGHRVTVAAIAGNAYGGGCELLTACHFRISVADATFSFRQAANGIITGWGGGLRLFRQLGRGPALRLLLTAENCPAEEALRLGFIDQIVARENLMLETYALAAKICSNDPRAVSAFLELSQEIYRSDTETFRERETDLFAQCWAEGSFGDVLKRFT